MSAFDSSSTSHTLTRSQPSFLSLPFLSPPPLLLPLLPSLLTFTLLLPLLPPLTP